MRGKRRATSNDFLRSSAKLLKNSNVFFKNRNLGDATANFKETLLQYYYFSVTKKLNEVRVDDSVSFESVKESGDQKCQRLPNRERKSKSKLIFKDSKEGEGDFKRIIGVEVDLEAEEETDIFYSPNSESFLDSKEGSEMAEEEEEGDEFIHGEEDEGVEEGTDESEDVFGGVEELVEKAEKEMDEIENNAKLLLDEVSFIIIL